MWHFFFLLSLKHTPNDVTSGCIISECELNMGVSASVFCAFAFFNFYSDGFLSLIFRLISISVYTNFAIQTPLNLSNILLCLRFARLLIVFFSWINGFSPCLLTNISSLWDKRKNVNFSSESSSGVWSMQQLKSILTCSSVQQFIRCVYQTKQNHPVLITISFRLLFQAVIL